jgi:uncharacterized protein involved in exopolysaccharide biosynthesis
MSDTSRLAATPQSTVPPFASPVFSDARDFLYAAWRRRRGILASALLLAAVAAAWSLVAPRRYEASLTLAVIPPRLGEPVVNTVPPQMIQSSGVDNFTPILSSHSVVAAVIEEFGLDEPPRGLRAGDFLRRVLTVRPLPDTAIARVIVTLDDPALAAGVANRLVDLAIARARAVNESAMSPVLDELKRAVDGADSRLQEAEARYADRVRTGQRNGRPDAPVQEPHGAGAAATSVPTLSRLEVERAIARTALERASTRYQNVQLESVGRTPEVVVVDAAVPPDQPVGRMVVRNVALGLLAGLLLGLAAVVLDVLRNGGVPGPQTG